MTQTEGRNKREIAELKEHILEPQQNKTGIYGKLFLGLDYKVKLDINSHNISRISTELR